MSYINYQPDDQTILPLERQMRSKALMSVLKTHPDLEGIIQLHDGNPPSEHPNPVARGAWTLLPHNKRFRAEMMGFLDHEGTHLRWIDDLKENGGWQALKDAPQINPAVYLSQTAIPELLSATEHYFNRQGVQVNSSSEICVGQGFRHLLNSYGAVMQDQGRNQMFIAAPFYGSLNEVMADRGVELIPIHTKAPDYELTPELIRQYSDQHPNVKDMIFIHPGNPTGHVQSKANLRAWAEVALEKGIFVVADEIYSGEELGNKKITSYAALGEEFYRHSLTGIGLGKTFCDAGDRIGIAVTGDETIAKAIQSSVRGTTSSPATMSQYSAALVLQYTPERFLEENRVFYRQRLELVEGLIERTNQQLSEHGSDIHLKIATQPDAGFYVTVSFENTKGKIAYDGEPINNALKLVEHTALSGLEIKKGNITGNVGITMLDGDSLGMSDDITTRINFALPKEHQLKTAFERLTESLLALTKERKPERDYHEAHAVKEHVFSGKEQLLSR